MTIATSALNDSDCHRSIKTIDLTKENYICTKLGVPNHLLHGKIMKGLGTKSNVSEKIPILYALLRPSTGN